MKILLISADKKSALGYLLREAETIDDIEQLKEYREPEPKAIDFRIHERPTNRYERRYKQHAKIKTSQAFQRALQAKRPHIHRGKFRGRRS